MATKQRVVMVTGGMGGLGETISTKMVDAGYKVVVTYSPGNTKHAEWGAAMKKNGYEIMAVPCDVSDFGSCTKAVASREWPGDSADMRAAASLLSSS